MRKKLVILTCLLLIFSIAVLTKLIFYNEKIYEKCHEEKNKVVIILLDGADWRIINTLLEQERLPTFKSLVESGSSGVIYSVDDYSTPNDISIFTGVMPSKHGITSHFYFENESRTLKQSLLSKMTAEPIWDTLGENYCSSVFSLIETPEAVSINNVMVGALFNLKNAINYNNIKVVNKYGISYMPFLFFKKLTYPSNLLKNFDLSFLKDTDKEMIPKGLLLDFKSPISDRMPEDTILALREGAQEKNGSSDMLIDGIRAVFNSDVSAKFIYDYDAITKNIALQSLKQEKSNIYFIYFQGTDTFAHIYYMDGWHMEDPEDSQEQVYKYYEVMDAYLSEIIKASGEDTTFLILSDTGTQDVNFQDYEDTKKFRYDKNSSWYKKSVPPHTAGGIFIAKGPNIIKNKKGIKADMTDIAPTLHCVLDISIDNKTLYDGGILTEIFEKDYQAKSACKMLEGLYDREKYTGWYKNKPEEFVNLNPEEKKYLINIIYDAIDDANHGRNIRYIWPKRTFSKNRIFVVLKTEGKTFGWWTERENLAEGVYYAIRSLLENFNLNITKKDVLEAHVHLLYNRRMLDDNFKVGVHSIFLSYEDNYSSYPNTYTLEQGYNKKGLLNHMCISMGLPIGCYSNEDVDFFYYDTIHFAKTSDEYILD